MSATKIKSKEIYIEKLESKKELEAALSLALVSYLKDNDSTMENTILNLFLKTSASQRLSVIQTVNGKTELLNKCAKLLEKEYKEEAYQVGFHQKSGMTFVSFT